MTLRIYTQPSGFSRTRTAPARDMAAGDRAARQSDPPEHWASEFATSGLNAQRLATPEPRVGRSPKECISFFSNRGPPSEIASEAGCQYCDVTISCLRG